TPKCVTRGLQKSGQMMGKLAMRHLRILERQYSFRVKKQRRHWRNEMILSIIIFITLCATTFMFYIETRTLAKKLKAKEDSYALLYKKICNEVDENSRLKIEIIQKNTIIQNNNVYIAS